MNKLYNFNKDTKDSDAWWCFWPSLVFLGISFVVSIIGGIIVAFLIIYNEGFNDPDQFINSVMKFLMPINIIAQVIGAAVFLPIYLKTKKEAFPKVTKKCHWSVWIWAILFMLGVSTISAFFIDLLSKIWTPADGGIEAVTEAIFSGSLWATVISTVIMAPLMEELMIRGLTLNKLLSGTTVKKSIIVSSIIFGIIHLNILQGLNAFVLGVVLALVYVKTRSLILCMLCHAANNLMSVIGGVLVINEVANVDAINMWMNIGCIVLGIVGTYFFFKSKDAELAPAKIEE